MLRADLFDQEIAMNHSMPALTGLRGLAALWVLFYHAWVYATPQEILLPLPGLNLRLHVLFSLGWAGVQVLFVLSAFLLTLPYARAAAGLRTRPAWGPYLWRRISRVFPAYYLQLAILTATCLLLTGVLLVNPEQLGHYLLMLYFPPPLGIGAPDAVNGVWWTLPIEFSFYLALPLLAFLVRWERRWWLFGLCLVSTTAWRYWTIGVLDIRENMHVWAYQLPGSMDAFGLGMLGALLHVQHVERSTDALRYTRLLQRLLLAVPLFFVAIAAWLDAQFETYWQPGPLLFLWTPALSLLALVVVLNAAVDQHWLLRLMANRAVMYLGLVSYGLYLWHPPLGSWLLESSWLRNMQGYSFPPLATGMLLFSLVLASLSWFLVEGPLMKAVRRCLAAA
jgi:peptidoglycan/LPS O-acetylase OafA/YrhL